jgi:hypothetical protein
MLAPVLRPEPAMIGDTGMAPRRAAGGQKLPVMNPE